MREQIEKLVAEELARASEKFPQFASHHEAWAVTYEELEEAIDEVKKLQESQLEILWQQVRSNSVDRFDLRVSTGTTIALIEELIQYTAMLGKWLALIDKEKTAS